jgi:hypothetical protein
LYVCLFSSNSTLFFRMIMSGVDCRQSGCSYNVESSFVEQRRTSASVCYRVSVVTICFFNTAVYNPFWRDFWNWMRKNSIDIRVAVVIVFFHHHHHHHHVHECLAVFPFPWSSKCSSSLHLFFGRPIFLLPFGLIVFFKNLKIWMWRHMSFLNRNLLYNYRPRNQNMKTYCNQRDFVLNSAVILNFSVIADYVLVIKTQAFLVGFIENLSCSDFIAVYQSMYRVGHKSLTSPLPPFVSHYPLPI